MIIDTDLPREKWFEPWNVSQIKEGKEKIDIDNPIPRNIVKVISELEEDEFFVVPKDYEFVPKSFLERALNKITPEKWKTKGKKRNIKVRDKNRPIRNYLSHLVRNNLKDFEKSEKRRVYSMFGHQSSYKCYVVNTLSYLIKGAELYEFFHSDLTDEKITINTFKECTHEFVAEVPSDSGERTFLLAILSQPIISSDAEAAGNKDEYGLDIYDYSVDFHGLCPCESSRYFWHINHRQRRYPFVNCKHIVAAEHEIFYQSLKEEDKKFISAPIFLYPTKECVDYADKLRFNVLKTGKRGKEPLPEYNQESLLWDYLYYINRIEAKNKRDLEDRMKKKPSVDRLFKIPKIGEKPGADLIKVI